MVDESYRVSFIKFVDSLWLLLSISVNYELSNAEIKVKNYVFKV